MRKILQLLMGGGAINTDFQTHNFDFPESSAQVVGVRLFFNSNPGSVLGVKMQLFRYEIFSLMCETQKADSPSPLCVSRDERR